MLCTACTSADTRTAARQASLDSREPYPQTEVYRFYDGPIDNPEDGPGGLINAWPLDEHTIDDVVGDPDAGIRQDRDLELTRPLAELDAAGWILLRAPEGAAWAQPRRPAEAP